MATRGMIRFEVHVLVPILLLYGLITSCTLAELRRAPSTQVTKKVEQQPPAAKPVSEPILNAEKPEWKIGYWWEYRSKRPGRSGIFTEEVIREDIFDGIPSYVTKKGLIERFYTRDSLGAIASMSESREIPITKSEPPRQSLSWPLEIGKEWRNTYSLESKRYFPLLLKGKHSLTIDRWLVVAKVEEVKVPAGIFEAFKIEHYESDSFLYAEYWYSPKVKWFVKIRIYHRDGSVRRRELISFNVD